MTPRDRVDHAVEPRRAGRRADGRQAGRGQAAPARLAARRHRAARARRRHRPRRPLAHRLDPDRLGRLRVLRAAGLHRLGDLPPRHLVAAHVGVPRAASTTPTSSCSSPAPTRRTPCSSSRARRVRRCCWWSGAPPSPACSSGSSGSTRRAGSTRRCTSRLGWAAVFFIPQFVDGADRFSSRHRDRHPGPGRRRRHPLHPRRRGLRPQAPEPVAALVRLPRGLPLVHGAGLRRPLRRHLAGDVLAALTPHGRPR